MNTKDIKSNLFDEFPNISSKEWKDKVNSDLKGADFNKKLVWRTDEGFDVNPYYRKEDIENMNSVGSDPGDFPYIRGKEKEGNDWSIRQDFNIKDKPEEANRNILEALIRGSNAIGLIFSEETPITSDFLQKLLVNIQIDIIEIHFTGIPDPFLFYDLLIEYINASGVDTSRLKGSLGVNPIGILSLEGELDEEAFTTITGLFSKSNKISPQFKIVGINTHIFQDGGSTIVQELAFGLSVANEYLDRLTSKGLSPENIMKSMLFSMATGPNYFMEIAKLRAARWLWSIICKAWGIKEEKIEMHIHSRSASWNLSIYDPFVNVLRTTTETMSASLGGSNSISVLPYDKSFKEENNFSGRVARNIQVILKEEAYFDKVADPAAGSYYIETLTDNIAEQAWKLFQKIEEEGGYINAFKSGNIQKQINQSLSEKKVRASSRKESILGVNQFPNFNEMVLEQNTPQPVKPGTGKGTYTPIGQFRIAEDFEALRMQTEKSKKRPKVFLLKYGPPVWMTARAMFAGNFFACAAYEIIDSSGFATIEEGIKAARETAADIVVLCSSDIDYAEIGSKVFEALKNESEIVIAGYPKDSIDDLRKAGLKHFIHIKSNLLEELKRFNKTLGIDSE